MKFDANVTAAQCTTATAPTLKELQATMRTWHQDLLARVCRFNLNARETPCCVCGDVMEMNDHEEIGVCEHAMGAIRMRFGSAANAPTMRPMESPLGGLRVFVKRKETQRDAT